MTPAVVDLPLVVSRDGEQRGFIYAVEGTRLEVEFLEPREQTRVEELIHEAQLDEVGPPAGNEFRDWAVRFIKRLQMNDVDLRGYLLALTTKGQESFRGVLKRDRTIRKAFPADTLETAAWSEVVDALMLDPDLQRRTLPKVVRLQQIARGA